MKFRLQKLLDIAIKEEELRKQELFKVRKEKENLLNEIEKNRKYLDNLENEFIGKKIQGNYLHMLLEIKQNGELYLENLYKKLEHVENLEQKILKEYLEKRKERMSFEKLKERAIQKFRIEQQRKENKNMDEIAERKFFFGGER
ncbi:flagellar export protein FliJ [Thermosipho melanesiensis]|uniref:Flagellar FliJ protein n=2 Tax=Thermosipho melanesiensis TaxID=46541 RepID=A6LLE7_THEM4|nr:flagellar export protein FliJ [Thermosipho melanesiensis]ABR30748.1 flagellar export protein FliJ [Thermosipho melanesiensis BI429]APT73871.1 flagellar export protein FliJ [Thermosipho melanesiensis]OOC35813.1 flagellar export protein FliJ [Thermosipho melanesiensis]OOC38315.1 flagellar export protein FliJ [Thermosipho melanesiensis]OOC38776.1 flagellar export protein FliJ [Thermosipho melanesiensis]